MLVVLANKLNKLWWRWVLKRNHCYLCQKRLNTIHYWDAAGSLCVECVNATVEGIHIG